tara:strand:+ start:900 stop:1157 length:258 start_codon:yes stop_codon:yes gene_type:complete
MKAVNLTYAILNITDVDKVIFEEIPETRTSIRKSINGSEFGIKYNQKPSFILDGSVVPLMELNHSEMLDLMATEEWTLPMEEPNS